MPDDGLDVRECADCGEEYDAYSSTNGHDCSQSQPIDSEDE